MMRGELQELGEDVDPTLDSISKVQTQILNTTHGKVNIFDDEGNFRNIYDIMKDISSVYDELSDTDRASLLEDIAGKNRANAVQAMITNWSQVEKATKEAYNSEGVASEEQAKYMDSLQGHLNQLTSSWQAFSADFMNSDFLKAGVDILKTIVNITDGLTKNLGTLGTIGLGVGFTQLIKNRSALKGVFSDLYNGLFKNQSFFFGGGINDTWGRGINNFKSFLKSPSGILSMVGIGTAVIDGIYTGIQNAKKKRIENNNKSINEYEENKGTYDKAEKAYITISNYTDATNHTAEANRNLASALSDAESALGKQAGTFSKLTGEANNYKDVLDEISKNKLKEELDDARSAVNGATGNLQEHFKNITGDSRDTTFYGSTKKQNSSKLIQKILKDYVKSDEESLYLTPNFSKLDKNAKDYEQQRADEIVKFYYKLKEARGKIGEKYGNNDSNYKALDKTINNLTDDVEKYVSVRGDELRIAYETEHGIPRTIEAYKKMEDAILKPYKGNVRRDLKESLRSPFEGIFDFESIDKTKQKTLSKLDYTKEIEKLKKSAKYRNVMDMFDNLDDKGKQIVYEISLKSDDTQLWTLDRWKNEINSMGKIGKTSADQMNEFNGIMAGTGDEDSGLQKKIEDYKTNLTELKDALTKVKGGNLSAEDKLNLIAKHGELAPYINDTNALANAIQNLIDSSNLGINHEIDAFLEQLTGKSPKAKQALEELRNAINELTGTSFDFKIDDEITKFENLYSAMKESVSATGLSKNAMANVKEMFYGLENYNPSKLFERTANGIHLNSKELRKLQSEYKQTKLGEINDELSSSIEKYNKLQDTLNSGKLSNAKRNQITDELGNLKEHIAEVSDLASQYEGLTSAYNNWIHAQSAGEEGDMYDSITSGLKTTQEAYEKGLVGTNAFRDYVDLLSAKDLSTASVDEVVAEWERFGQVIQGTSYKTTDFLSEGKSGVENFLKATQQVNDKWAKMNADGSWKIDFGYGSDKEVADRLGLDIEFVQSMLKKLHDYGFDINLDSLYSTFDKLTSSATEANQKLKDLGKTKVDFDFNTNELHKVKSDIDEAQKIVDKFKDSNGKIDLSIEGASEAETCLYTLLRRKQDLEKPFIMNVSTDGLEEKTEKAVSSLQKFIESSNSFDRDISVGADTSDAQNEIKKVASTIKGLDPEIKAKLGLENSDIKSAIDRITNTNVNVEAGVNLSKGDVELVRNTIEKINPTILANVGISPVETAAVNSAVQGASLGINTNLKIDTSKQTVGVDLDVNRSELDKISNEEIHVKTMLDPCYDLLYGKPLNLPNGKKPSVDVRMKPKDDEVKNYKSPKNKSMIVSIKGDATALNNIKFNRRYMEVATKFIDNIPKELHGTIYYTAVVSQIRGASAGLAGLGIGRADGTAHAQGTAFAQGSWGTKDSGVALGGELGEELVVRNGRYFTIGSDGAEFFKYKRGDIIFNAGQTAEIFKYGKIKNGKKRGEAFAQGNAFSDGVGAFHGGASSSSSSSSKSSSNSKSNSSSKDDKDKEPQYFDWIEIAIKRIERVIENLSKKATDTFKTWTSRANALANEISKVSEEINLQSRAYDRYIKQANSVGLSASLAQQVRDGKIDITQYDSDSEEYKKIQKYQEWYEKAIACQDAVDDLKRKESELYKERFDNIATEYDKQLEVYEFRKSMIEEKINQQETKGHLISKEYYSALISQEKDNISDLTSKLNELIVARDEAVNAGKVDKYSESWYEMSNQIDQVTLSIEKANSSILNYNKSIRESNWKIFDLIQDKISKITKESDFLIKLMSKEKLHDDNGLLTKHGTSTIGLHAVNYDTYMEQADKYASEIKKLNKEISKDSYDEELIKRKQELIELQQEAILGANEEKNAIKEVVKEGIEKELEALKKLTEKYKESLSSQKDLYDYQKKVKDQTKEIASLQKQLDAYSNDSSEETKAKIQKLKVSLEDSKENLKETEYDKYISDTEKMLDNLYDEYETTLNTRLDNIDKLLSDMIDTTNANSTEIKTTIQTELKNVGYTLSDEMKAVWNTGGGANTIVATYGNGISGTLTTIGTVIASINTRVQNMAVKLGAEAKAETKTATATPTKKENTTSNKNTGNTNQKANTQQAKATTNKSNNKKTRTNKDKYGVALAIWNGGYGWGVGDTRKQRLEAKGFSYNEIQNIIEKMAKDGYIYSNAWVGKYEGITNLTPYHYNNYATGSKKISSSQMAWTQENGMEFIVRPSDGAILTPLAKSDSVLTANASRNIWNMANNPTDFIIDNLKPSNINNVRSKSSSNSFNSNISVELTLPNVKNYEEFKNAMKHDKNFENMVRAMTVDKVFGGSSLKKYNY